MGGERLTPRIGIAIPAYKDAPRLKRCLDSIARVDPDWLAHVTVVDDSGDGQVAAELREEFKVVKWIVHEQNHGFAIAANRAVVECVTEWVLLLNDDSELSEDPRPALADMLESDDLFALSLRSIDESGRDREGAKRLVWRFGIAKIMHNKRDQARLIEGVSETAYAVGGHAVFSRERFIALDGFDRAYHPFYWEDVDLCERARQRGLRVAFCADARVIHNTSGAIRTSNDTESIRNATWRNRLVFSMRHATGLQRMLLPVGIAWHQLTARLKKDHALLRALADCDKIRRNQ